MLRTIITTCCQLAFKFVYKRRLIVEITNTFDSNQKLLSYRLFVHGFDSQLELIAAESKNANAFRSFDNVKLFSPENIKTSGRKLKQSNC